MPTPAIAHFGTTLAEDPPGAGVDQASLPLAGDLERTDAFLKALGMERFLSNMYPGLGRQYIYRRGKLGAHDYFEKDTFTSYSAQPPPPCDVPRVAETIFRLPLPDPIPVCRRLIDEGLAEGCGPAHELDGFLAGALDSVLLLGPDRQRYELTASHDDPIENHAIFIWTDPLVLAETAAAYAEQFGIAAQAQGPQTFHGNARLTLLQRAEPPVSIGLLTPLEGGSIAPRWTDDIFKEAGYSHFRLGAPRKEVVKAANREVFPDTGDVSYILFHESYLELVQA